MNPALTWFCFCFVTVFLGVTDLQANQVEMTSLCARWQIHRHATAYRIVLESLQGKYNFVKYSHACVCADHLGKSYLHAQKMHVEAYPSMLCIHKLLNNAICCWSQEPNNQN
jgi:hypothetical protein